MAKFKILKFPAKCPFPEKSSLHYPRNYLSCLILFRDERTREPYKLDWLALLLARCCIASLGIDPMFNPGPH
jgi:hypothetical protein